MRLLRLSAFAGGVALALATLPRAASADARMPSALAGLAPGGIGPATWRSRCGKTRPPLSSQTITNLTFGRALCGAGSGAHWQ